MSQDVEYEPDVLQFKQIWTSNNNTSANNNKNDKKFKQINKSQPDPKNLQTIESNTKKTTKNRPPSANNANTGKILQQKNTMCQTNYKVDEREQLKEKINDRVKQKTKEKSKQKQSIASNRQKPDTNHKPKTVYSSTQKNILRNPQPNKPEQIIEVTTNPKPSYTSSLSNQKNNIVNSHLILGGVSLPHGSNFGNYDISVNQNSSSNKYHGSTNNHTLQYDLKSQLAEKDYELSLLRVTNSKNEDRIRYLQAELMKKQEIIHQMKIKQRKYISKNCELQSKELNFDYGKVEYQNYKNDSKRLLKMLQGTNQYKLFADLAINDNGVRFLHHANRVNKSKIDANSGNSKSSNPSVNMHFCTCNKTFIPESSFWVPQKVYSFGKEFIKQRSGQNISESELELMLYELNKIWREREKKIVNYLSAIKGHEVSKYKRQIQNMNHTSRQKDKKSLSINKNYKKSSRKQQDYEKEQQNQEIQQ